MLGETFLICLQKITLMYIASILFSIRKSYLGTNLVRIYNKINQASYQYKINEYTIWEEKKSCLNSLSTMAE